MDKLSIDQKTEKLVDKILDSGIDSKSDSFRLDSLKHVLEYRKSVTQKERTKNLITWISTALADFAKLVYNLEKDKTGSHNEYSE